MQIRLFARSPASIPAKSTSVLPAPQTAQTRISSLFTIACLTRLDAVCWPSESVPDHAIGLLGIGMSGRGPVHVYSGVHSLTRPIIMQERQYVQACPQLAQGKV